MATYTISETAKKYSLEPHTLRYYEKEGILSPGKTEGGVRFYTESDLEQLEMICCLKNTGMTIKNIRKYFDLCAVGSETVKDRLEIFTSQRQQLLNQIQELQKNLAKIDKKIQWYTEKYRMEQPPEKK